MLAVQNENSNVSAIPPIPLNLLSLHFSPSIEIRNCEANDLGVVWCSYNEQTNRLHIYRCLLTNRLHGKAAELCLANSKNNRVTTTKYIKYINSIQGTCYSL